MNLQWVPLDDVIANLESTYGINSNNYIHKLSLWITQALANYSVFIPMEAAYVDMPIENGHIIYMPEDVKTISGLNYKGHFAHQAKAFRGFREIPMSMYNQMISVTGFQIEVTKDEDGNVTGSRKVDVQIPVGYDTINCMLKYYVNNSRVLTVDFGEVGDTVRLYYIRLPHSRDPYTGAMIPMVPDNEVVKQNLSWFILQQLLYSGYKHPILNLGAASPYLNPAKMYHDTKGPARSQFLQWDRADYGKVKNLMTTLLHSYSDHTANLIQH